MAASDAVSSSDLSSSVPKLYDFIQEPFEPPKAGIPHQKSPYDLIQPIVVSDPSNLSSDRSMGVLCNLVNLHLQSDRVQIAEQLGSGCSSRVYSLRTGNESVKRAIKIIRPSKVNDRSDFAMASENFHPAYGDHLTLPLRHPSILSSEKCLYLTDGKISEMPLNANSRIIAQVIPYFPGISLTEAIQRRPPHLKMLSIASQVASGMAHLCANRINHGDAHPENILIDKEGNAVLIDFGLAHLFSSDTGVVFNRGRWEYQAPEVIIRRPRNSKSEAWTFGVTLYQMYHRGSLPFKGEAELLSGQFSIGADVPLEIADLIRSLLVINPDGRLSIYEARDRLKAMVLQ